MTDCIIIGQGPAGISAAMYVCRAGFSAAVIRHGESALEKAHKIENYYGLQKPVSGRELLSIGERQAADFGAVFIEAEVTGLSGMGPFEVHTENGEYIAKTLIIATGKPHRKPPIGGLAELEGRGVSYCAVCDGFFYKGKTVGVLGAGAYAAAEASHLAGLCGVVIVYTNGEEPTADFPDGVKTDRREISRVTERGNALSLVFKNNEQEKLDGLFVAVGTASAVDFAAKLGIITKDGSIPTGDDQMTNVRGVFAAGDCTGGLCQVATAVGQGAAAGTGA
ncbi:MAG TPA: hypothetical protein DEQ02_06170, partial [Ruminococcaceae bacterium]|nr:hypothetical protein [Oscillospiraceae bacterium]